MTSPPPTWCLYCEKPLTDRKLVGRPKLYCSDAHRSADHRRQVAADPELAAHEFAVAVDRAVTGCGHSAQWLIQNTRSAGGSVSAPSLSGWRSGHSIPYLKEETRDVLLSMERFVPMPPGHLLGTLERTALARGRNGWPEPQIPRPRRPLSEPEQLMMKLATEEGFCSQGRVAVVEARDSLTIAPDRRPARCDSSYRLCALRPGVRRFAVVMTVDHRNPIELEAVRHCRIARKQSIRRGNSRYSVLGVEFELDRELDAYEPYDLEFVAVNQPVPAERRLPMPGWAPAIGTAACRFQQLRLTFAGERPKQVWQFQLRHGPERMPKPENEIPVTSADGSFELSLTNPPPGNWGWRWRWTGAQEAGTFAAVPTR